MTGNEPTAAESLVEALAWWSEDPGRDRRALSDAAAQALVDGLDSAALRELAGIRADDNPFEIDELIARTAEDLDLRPLLASGRDVLAARRLSRWVIAGEVPERELSRWAHKRFHHESDIDAMNRLAELDDDLDEIGLSDRRMTDVLRRIRAEATRLLEPR